MKHQVIGTKLKKVFLVLFVAFMLATGGVLLSACGSISLSVNFVVDGEIVKTVDTNGNEVITVPENPTKDGYEFAGWYWDYGTWTQPFTANSLLDTPISSDMNVYAHFNAIQYSIFYHLDGGENSEYNPSEYTIESGFSLYSATKNGYLFAGWYTDVQCTNEISAIEVGTKGDINLYASWQIEPYSITYENLDGATSTGNNAQSYTILTESIVLNEAEKYGFNFLDWYDSNGNKVEVIEQGSYGNLTLYAKWEEIVLTATLYGDETSTETFSISSPLLLSDLTKNGYTFNGWFLESTFKNKVEEITYASANGQNIAVYASWTKNEYTVSFVTTGTNANTIATYDVETDYELLDSSLEGYTFIGWYLESDYRTKVTNLKGLTGNITLYALFEVGTYSLSFETDGGEKISEINYSYGSAIEELPTPVKTGNLFEGWYSDVNLTTAFSYTTMPAQNLTAYAKWTEVEYDISYVLPDGASNPNEIKTSYTISEDFFLQDAELSGYNFLGWYLDENYSTKITNLLGYHEDLTLYAYFMEGVYSITYVDELAATNDNETTYKVTDENIVLQNLSYDTYTFLGWYDEEENLIETINTGLAKNRTLTAKWGHYAITIEQDGGNENVSGIVKEAYVYFYLNYNSTVSSQKVDYSTRVTYPSIPTRSGYLFTGWYTDSTCTELFDFDTTIIQDVKLYAGWQKITYTTQTNFSASTLTQTFSTSVSGPTLKYIAYAPLVSQTITVYSTGTVDTYGRLYNSNGKQLVSNDDGGTDNNFSFSYAVTAGNLYYIVYSATSDSTSGNCTICFEQTQTIPTIGGTYPIKSVYVTAGKTVYLNTTKIYAYDFVGWYAGEELISTEFSCTYRMPSSDLTITAKYAPIEYEIEYNLDDGENSEDNPEKYNIESEEIVLKDATKVGHTFKGWFMDEELTESITSIPTGTTEKITLYAKFEINQYTISFESNGGSAVASITQDYATTVTKPADPTKSGYTFAGWYSNAELTIAYTFTTMPAEDITLYAKWEIVNYSITYHLDNGENSEDNPETYTVHDSIVFADASKKGYTFIGWYTDESYENEITEIAAGSTGKISIYAYFEIIDYSITYYLDGGKNSEDNPLVYTVEDEITLAAATKVGHTFLGWFTDEDLSERITSIATGTTEDIDLYAKFEINQYTISFETNGGSEVASITQNYATAVTQPADPTRNGYTFAGWYSDSSFKNEYSFTTISAEDITLYAKWNVINYSITYHLNNGENSENNPLTYTVEDEITLAAATKVGYTFKGWFKDAEFTESITSIAAGTAEDVDLYAKFEINQYTISFETNGGSEVASITQNYATAVTQPADPTRDGYAFVGWYSDVELTIAYTFTTMPAEDITLYAKWNAIDYEVTYVTEGTNPNSKVTTYNIETDYELEQSYLKDYTFIGWFTADTTDEAYLITNLKGYFGNLTLYAKFEYGTEGLIYSYSNSEATVIGYSGIETDVIIPETFNSFSVVSIEDNSFYNCDSLTSIIIPESLTSIGSSAFYGCSNLTAVYVDSIATWLQISFGSATANPLYYAGNLYVKDENDDGYTLLTELTIPTTFVRINAYAFYNCTNLTGIIIPDGVTTIGSSAFEGCSNLTAVYVDNIEIWLGISFGNSTANPLYYAGNLYVKSENDEYELLIELTIPATITTINDYAFYYCTSLTIVTIGSGVTSMGTYAFCGCTALTGINFNATAMDDLSSSNYVFAYAGQGGNGIIVNIGANVTKIPAYLFDPSLPTYKPNIIAVVFAEGSKCESIGGYAFYSLGLTEITIPNSVTSIGNCVFYNCTSLTTVTIGSNITSIGSSAFAYCTSLTSVTIRSDVTSIGNSAFYGCTGLTKVTIPDSVTDIGSSAFNGCTNLTAVYVDSIETWLDISFGNSTANPLCYANNLYVKDGNDEYRLLTEITIPATFTTINDYALYNCTSLTSVTIGSSVTSIGSSAFYGCTGLTKITIPDSVTDIGSSAFNGCTNLTAVYVDSIETWLGISFGNSVANPLYYAGNLYVDGSLLTALIVPGSVETINDYAFYYCTSLTSVTIGNGVTSIGNSAFAYCTSLTSVTIRSDVTSIGSYAFRDCTSLTSVTFANTSGWTAETIPISSTNLASTSKAATYLKSTYCKYTWTRSDD